MNRSPLPPRTPLNPRRKPLKPMSDNRRADLKRRAQIRKVVLERDGRCVLAERLRNHPGWPAHVCRGNLVPNHARKASGGGPYSEDNLDAVCWAGNAWIEDWPIEAKALGLVR